MNRWIPSPAHFFMLTDHVNPINLFTLENIFYLIQKSFAVLFFLLVIIFVIKIRYLRCCMNEWRCRCRRNLILRKLHLD
jgi:hypothetical protein